VGWRWQRDLRIGEWRSGSKFDLQDSALAIGGERLKRASFEGRYQLSAQPFIDQMIAIPNVFVQVKQKKKSVMPRSEAEM
jgi:hypothetical protein